MGVKSFPEIIELVRDKEDRQFAEALQEELIRRANDFEEKYKDEQYTITITHQLDAVHSWQEWEQVVHKSSFDKAFGYHLISDDILAISHPDDHRTTKDFSLFKYRDNKLNL